MSYAVNCQTDVELKDDTKGLDGVARESSQDPPWKNENDASLGFNAVTKPWIISFLDSVFVFIKGKEAFEGRGFDILM